MPTDVAFITWQPLREVNHFRVLCFLNWVGKCSMNLIIRLCKMWGGDTLKVLSLIPPLEITAKKLQVKEKAESWKLSWFLGFLRCMTMTMTMVVCKRAKRRITSKAVLFFIFRRKAWNECAVTLQNVYNRIISCMNYALNNLQM